MTTEIKTKTAPAVALALSTDAGSSSVIDTSGWQYMQLMTWGTTGSVVTSVHVNPGTTAGTAATTMPDLLFVGSAVSDGAEAGNPVWHCGSLTMQAVITHGTTAGTFNTSYIMYE